MKFPSFLLSVLIIVILITLFNIPAKSQGLSENNNLDEKVKNFLDKHSWHDMNIPASDGKTLYNIIIKNNYKSALEIGTSTGHSGIWIAWALSKTGGKLITVEIDESRHETALKNFKEAGLIDLIDARLGNAHKIVPELKGPFDFVFSDADKDWYKNYFIAVDPKLKVGGSFVSHNVYSRDRRGTGMAGSFVPYILSLPNYETTFNESGNGLSISYKKSEK